MNQLEAKNIAVTYLQHLQKNCPVEMAFNDDLTEDHAIGFVFFYNSKLFWETRDFQHSLAGNGPLLVEKKTGNTVVLPSHQSVKKSLAQLD